MQINIPENLQDLMLRCQQMANQSVGSLAADLNLPVPAELNHAKGWLGQLIEIYLGASAQNQAMQDFPELGIELKTIPITQSFKPLESTYVCTVQTNEAALHWHDSWVYRKLKQVLWVPIISAPNSRIQDRIICTPILWQMTAELEQILRTDWEELMEMLQLGYAKNLSAKFGTYLHIRPKAANSKVLIDYVNHDGSATRIVPKGFYLRPSFTQLILSHFSVLSTELKTEKIDLIS